MASRILTNTQRGIGRNHILLSIRFKCQIPCDAICDIVPFASGLRGRGGDNLEQNSKCPLRSDATENPSFLGPRAGCKLTLFRGLRAPGMISEVDFGG
jgi:hypothetical protein